jgi:hypothetical protein
MPTIIQLDPKRATKNPEHIFKKQSTSFYAEAPPQEGIFQDIDDDPMNFGQVEEQLSLGLGRDEDFAHEDDENMEKDDTPN